MFCHASNYNTYLDVLAFEPASDARITPDEHAILMWSGMYKRNKRGRLIAIGAVLFVCGCLVPSALLAETKFFAPNLNVPIPGLDFKDYPIIIKGGKISIPFLSAYIATIYRYIVGISTVAAAIMIVYGGFRYIAGSASGGAERGKEIIRDAVVGLILLLGSYTIFTVINSAVLELGPITMDYIKTQSILAEGTTPTDVNEDPKTKSTPPAPNEDPQYKEVAPPPGKSPTIQPAEGGTTIGENKGCIGDKRAYSMGAPACSGLNCCSGKVAMPAGLASLQDLKSFSYFPKAKDKQQQINQYGLFMTDNIRAPNNGLRPEAHAALFKAGEIAKSKGYYIKVFDMYRSWEFQLEEYCKRVKKSGSSQGMAAPGSSPHGIGIAVDVSLFKIGEDNKALTGHPPLCDPKNNNNQVDIMLWTVDRKDPQKAVDYLYLIEDIMAEVGFYHYCSETWHFDYGGVLPTMDCTRCAFPPSPRKGSAQCKIQYQSLLKQIKTR